MRIVPVIIDHHEQTVRLPAELRLPDGVSRVQVSARGVDRILSPVGYSWDSFFLNGPRASDDFMAEPEPR
jgi:antitoxin VapB